MVLLLFTLTIWKVKMKLSNETQDVLKNFSTINQNLVIKAGSNITTMSAMKNIVAKATVIEDFPKDFAIYDLNEFLAAVSLFEIPVLYFHNDFVVITEQNSKGKALQYWYSDPSVVTTPTKDITMPSTEVTYTFTNNTLAEVTKAAAVMVLQIWFWKVWIKVVRLSKLLIRKMLPQMIIRFMFKSKIRQKMSLINFGSR